MCTRVYSSAVSEVYERQIEYPPTRLGACSVWVAAAAGVFFFLEKHAPGFVEQAFCGFCKCPSCFDDFRAVSFSHLRAHETKAIFVCRLLLD